MTTVASHTTRASGTVLTAAIYNSDHNVHVSNAQALNSTKLEGATPPVVDGQAVVWNGTSGVSLRSGGFAPIPATRLVSSGSGLSGGGDLSADRTLAIDFATQAEAEAAATTVDVMSPLRVKQQVDFRLSNQATAEARTDNTKLMTPLRVDQEIISKFASLAQAQAGTDNTVLMTPLRVADAIAAISGGIINIGAALSGVSSGSPFVSGVNATPGAIFLFAGATSLGGFQVSTNGGTNFTSLGLNSGSAPFMGVVAVSGSVAAGCVLGTSGAAVRVTTTGNTTINFACTSGSTGIIRIV